MNKIIIFNGPPGSGKDTLAELCRTSFYISGYTKHHMRFKTILFEHTIDLFRIDPDVFYRLYNDRVSKEKKTELLSLNEMQFSPREAMIYTSEDVYKPLYGKDYFGQKLAESIPNKSMVFVSDGGFVEEIDPLVYKFGSENIFIIKLFRHGCDFKKDSRRYLDIPDVKTISFHNNGSEELLITEMLILLNDQLNIGVEIAH